MSQQQLDYPRWYIGLRGFILGIGVGALLMSGLIVGQVITADRWWHQLILPAIVNLGVLAITGFFEITFAIRRYRRVRRELAGRAAAT